VVAFLIDINVNLITVLFQNAGHNGCVISGINCLLLLNHWDCDFETHSQNSHISVSACCPASAEALQQAGPLSKRYNQMSRNKIHNTIQWTDVGHTSLYGQTDRWMERQTDMQTLSEHTVYLYAL
jgi:hypothetical protein